jgi:hypothetical protein
MLLLVLPPVALAILALTWLAISKASSQVQSSRFDQMAALAQQHANDFDAQVRRSQTVARTLAATVQNGNAGGREAVNAMLRTVLDQNPQAVGTYVNFVDNGFDGPDAPHIGEPGATKTGDFGPYWNRLGGAPKLDAVAPGNGSDYWDCPRTPAARRSSSPICGRARC